jgi:hypothetical protein
MKTKETEAIIQQNNQETYEKQGLLSALLDRIEVCKKIS